MKNRFVLLVLNKANLACEEDYEAYAAVLGLDALQRDLNGWFYVMAGAALRVPQSSLPPVVSASDRRAALEALGLLDAEETGTGDSSKATYYSPSGAIGYGRTPVYDDYLDAQERGQPIEARVVAWIQRFFIPWQTALASIK